MHRVPDWRRLGLGIHIRQRLGLSFRALREYLQYDSSSARAVMSRLMFVAGYAFHKCGFDGSAVRLLTLLHRTHSSRRLSERVESLLRRSNASLADGPTNQPFCAVYRNYVEAIAPTLHTQVFFNEPQRLLGTRALVVKSWSPGERGVLILDYSFMFPLFMRLFDIGRVSERYYLVLEPGWVGYCTPEILCYTMLDAPVFVQSGEPEDSRFLTSLNSNLVPVPIASNWWIDHRIFRPLAGSRKDIDLAVVAGWADFKRHSRIFSAMRRLKQKGVVLRAVLVGYPLQRRREEIAIQAEIDGVADQIEWYEWLRPEEVNVQLNRAKVNVLWSRKEGCNKAIIEGMLADVPCVVRDGYNFGYRYPHINEATGCFAREDTLDDALVGMAREYQRFSPRQWVLSHMSCQHATRVLEETIRGVAIGRGETWTRSLVVKNKMLNAMQYYDPSDTDRFRVDYSFLESWRRGA